jgi:predicted TIM-barrel fold metal-dependent hydrolase
MDAHWMISSDSHVVEPPTLFVDRIDRRWRDEAPRVVEEDGVDLWVLGDQPVVPAINPSRAGDRFEGEQDRRKRVKFDQDVRPGGYEPDAWVRDNESDGVYGAVLFPSLSLVFYGIEKSELLSAVCRVFTDWVIEFASAYPKRMRAIAMINLDDVDAAVKELERARNAGATGALIPTVPQADRPYDSPEYERFWAAAAALEMPLNLHVATNRTPGEWKALYNLSRHVSAPDYWVRTTIGDLIFSGVFERYPGLRVGSVENEAGWAAYFLRRMDHIYRESIDFASLRPSFKDGALPSDFFHQNVFVSFTEDDVAVANRDLIGVSNLMWGNDYPHGESTFPRSREIVARQLAGVSEEERRALTATNVAALYDFELPTQGEPL